MRVFLICVASVLIAAGCGTIAQSEPAAVPMPTLEAVDTAMITYGVELYRYYYCGTCHTLSAANTRGTFGPNHDAAGLNATQYIGLDNYAGNATTAFEYLRESILNPQVFYTPGFVGTNHNMPAFTNLSDAELDAIVYLLLHQIDAAAVQRAQSQ